MTDLLLHSLTDRLGHLDHDVLALRLSGGGALLLRHGPGGGGALGLGHSGALLSGLRPGGGHHLGGAGRVCDVPAGGAGHRLEDCPALGSVVTLVVLAVPTVAVAGLSLGIGRTQGEWEQANTEQELGGEKG